MMLHAAPLALMTNKCRGTRQPGCPGADPHMRDHSPLVLKLASRCCHSTSLKLEGLRAGAGGPPEPASIRTSSSKPPSLSHFAGYGQNFRSCFDRFHSVTNA